MKSAMPGADGFSPRNLRYCQRFYELYKVEENLPQLVAELVRDTHQHHFSETPVFVGRGVRAVGTNESNTYRRTERKNTVLRSANQYSRTQPITCRKRRFLNCRGVAGRLENRFAATHTDTNVGILDDNR